MQDWARMFWPSLAAAEAGAALTRQMLAAFTGPAPAEALPPEPAWASANEIVLTLPAARLRRFATGEKSRRPILVCAPFAVHGPQIADLAPGHSLMAVLRQSGAPLYLVEWLSATPAQAHRRIDDFLCDLNVIVDEIGGKSDFVGLCQGGWLGLIYAARFPAKAGRLVLAGAPIDIEAEASPLSLMAGNTPLEAFWEIVRLGEGLARGERARSFWSVQASDPESLLKLLQSDLPPDAPAFAALAEAYRQWDARTLDLPGAYYLEVVDQFYKRNALARGEFVALGKILDLAALHKPLFLLAAEDDQVTAPGQTFACAEKVGSPAKSIRRMLVPGNHQSLFLGARNLREAWPEIVNWLGAKG